MDADKAKKIQRKLRPVLLPFSVLFGGGVNIRQTLYDIGVLKAHEFDRLKVVGVGGIVAGGSGKTPVVIEIAKRLMVKGKTCVITGNYPVKDRRTIVVSDGRRIFKHPPAVSDEAYMIARKVPVTVISSKNRKAALELAVGLNMEFAVMDDALHHFEIKKNLEICVVDMKEPFDNGLYLPAGMLRAPKKALERCDAIICFDKSGSLSKEVSFDCHRARFEFLGVFDYKHRRLSSVSSAFVFCGIGNPQAFLQFVKRNGIEVLGYRFFADHHIYNDEELDELRRLKRECGADILLTTYKDFVKIERSDFYYVDVETRVENLQEILGRLYEQEGN